MLIFVILQTCISKLIIQPHTNATGFQNYPIDYSVSNFGHIPYGQTKTGRIFLAPTNEADPEKQFCNLDALNWQDQYFNYKRAKWILVSRGTCPFTRKVINAQNISAELVIVVDNRAELTTQIIMADDGNGYQVTIPSVLITQKNGEDLIRLLNQNPGAPLHGVLEFNENERVVKPHVIFGLNIENRETFKLLRDFYPFRQKLNDSIDFDIYYEILTCPACKDTGYQNKLDDCIGGGRYCQLDPDQQGFGNGRDVVTEQLRQYLLWELNQTAWWDYMDQFDLNCLAPKAYAACFTNLVPQNIDAQVQENLSKSFDVPLKGDGELSTNKILDKMYEMTRQTGIIFYPGVAINHKAYRGNVEALEIFQAICGSMMTPHQACTDNQSELSPGSLIIEEARAEENSYFWLIVFVILSSVLFLVFVKFIYSKYLKRDNEQAIKMKVEDMVNSYMRFYEQNQGNN